MTNEPLYSVSPTRLTIGSDSPVNKDSLTSIVPSLTTASTIICLPLDNFKISSMTTSTIPISCSKPSLTTMAVGAESKDNLSIIFLALISCMIPIVVLIATITTDTAWVNCAPVASNKATIEKIKRLKNVKTFEMIILPIVFVEPFSETFTKPARCLFSTSSDVNPSKTSGLYLSTIISSLDLIRLETLVSVTIVFASISPKGSPLIVGGSSTNTVLGPRFLRTGLSSVFGSSNKAIKSFCESFAIFFT